MKLARLLPLGLAAMLLAPLPPAYAQDWETVTIETIPVADNVYMLTGRGGNIGLSVGPDGAFLVDDQYAPLTDKIKDAIAALTDAQVHFVVNTHWHGDHTGGNENLGEDGALIVAHENVRKRMSTEQFMEAFDNTVPPSPEAALPVITFGDGVTFHWNEDALHIHYVPNAHTDGDAIIHFEVANVLHLGDTYFNGMYPFIDTSSGGSIDGMIAAADRALALADAATRIIPGHGPLSDKAELQAYRDMLATARAQIKALVDQGLDRNAVINAKPTAHLDAAWGGGFMEPDLWVGLVYDSLK